jgi:hypothetical protein
VTTTPEIKFFNFPLDFNPDANFFLDLTKEVLKKENFFRPIHFYGCYPQMSTFKKALLYFQSKISDTGMTRWLNLQQGVVIPDDPHAFNIGCTYENRRPPLQGFDLTFSFDVDNYSGKNYYLPLIYLYMNHSKISPPHSKHLLSPCVASQNRDVDKNFIEKKSGFASAFINNPHPMRLRAIDSLSKIEKVELFGRSVNNYVNDKIDTASLYWFNLCFENDLYPGYVTEKILEAWISKSVPLYWGYDEAKILNPDAFVNLKDFNSLEDFVVFVSELYLDKDRMVEMISQPLFKYQFDYNEVVTFLLRGLRARVEESN